VYFMRMLSPVGVNSQFCCDYYGLSLLTIHAVCKTLASWSAFRQSVLPKLDRIYTIKELLRVKFGFMFLPFFDAEQVDCLLADLCTGWLLFLIFTFFNFLYFLYDFIINI